jgi:hypothetical protein
VDLGVVALMVAQVVQGYQVKAMPVVTLMVLPITTAEVAVQVPPANLEHPHISVVVGLVLHHLLQDHL